MSEDSGNQTNGKGKAPVANDEDANGAEVDMSSDSLTTRLTNSASGLARSMFGASVANGVLDDLASSSTLGGKTGQSGGSFTSQDANISRRQPSSRYAGAETVASQHGPQVTQQQDGFRDQNAAQRAQVNADFDSFVRDGPQTPDAFSPHHNTHTSPLNWAADFSNGSMNQFQEVPFQHALQGNSHVHQAEMHDGADVLDLLTDPTFSPGTDLYELPQLDDTVEQDASDLFGENFNPEERQIAQTMRSNLPAPPTHGRVNPAHPHSLSFAFDDDVFARLNETLDQLSLSDADEVLHQVSQENGALRYQLQRDWEAVSGNYTDEVWGDLLPEVKQAQEDINAIASGKKPLDSKAVARLKMILGHIDPRAASLQSSGILSQPSHRPAPLDLQKPSSYNDVSDLIFETIQPITSSQVIEPAAVSGGRSFYECPNQACLQTFPTNEAWAAHIAHDHQHLFDQSSPILVEGYPVPWNGVEQAFAEIRKSQVRSEQMRSR